MARKTLHARQELTPSAFAAGGPSDSCSVGHFAEQRLRRFFEIGIDAEPLAVQTVLGIARPRMVIAILGPRIAQPPARALPARQVRALGRPVEQRHDLLETLGLLDALVFDALALVHRTGKQARHDALGIRLG